MQVLALDFDGVISDSAPESYLVARRTYAALRPDSPLARGELAAPGPAAPLAQVAAAPRYAGFLEHMPLGNRAEDYGVVLAALEAGAPLPDQAGYDAFRDRQDAEWLRAFHRHFYRTRSELSQTDPEGWLALLRPYPELLEVLRRRAGEVTLAIATAKDRRSVGLLLEAYGATDLFPEALRLDKETGVSKSAHMEHLRRVLGVEYAEITFVDDKVNHLDSTSSLGVRCGLATWGYNGPREAELARERGYPLLRLESLEAQLYD